jgi:hypothetical protein
MSAISYAATRRLALAEIEIHHGHEGSGDKLGQRVGVLVGVIGILLAVVTIASHRAHTAAVVRKTEANDQWSYYQAKKIREYTASVAGTVVQALGSDGPRTQAAAQQFQTERAKYAADAEGIRKQASDKDGETEKTEAQALRFDLGEGFLELGLVVTSLYFLAKRRFFPVLGVTAGIIGVVFGALGFLL